MRRLMGLIVLAATMLHAIAASAHNNPTFEKRLVAEVRVEAKPDAAGAYSAPFTLDLPENAIQLYYAVAPATDGAPVTFAISTDGKILASGLKDGGRSKALRGKDLTIVNVEGASGPFTLQLTVETMVRPKKE